MKLQVWKMDGMLIKMIEIYYIHSQVNEETRLKWWYRNLNKDSGEEKSIYEECPL